jgi:hypothetical protein
VRIHLHIFTIAICTVVIGLALPNWRAGIDFWAAMAALFIALLVSYLIGFDTGVEFRPPTDERKDRDGQ